MKKCLEKKTDEDGNEFMLVVEKNNLRLLRVFDFEDTDKDGHKVAYYVIEENVPDRLGVASWRQVCAFKDSRYWGWMVESEATAALAKILSALADGLKILNPSNEGGA